MSSNAAQTYRVQFDPNNQELAITGYMRPQREEDLSACIQLFEQAVAAYPEKSERFLQVSGLTFSIDPAQQAGSRVHDVAVNGAALDENAQYTVVCTADASIEGAQDCGVLSWTLCDALISGAAQFTGEPMEARVNEAALPTVEPTAEPAATDQPNN